MNKIIEWFIKKAYPIIIKLLITYSEEIVRGLMKLIYKYIAEREKRKAEQSLDKAKASFVKAEEANTEEEKRNYLFEYEFYKKQADLTSMEIQDLAKDFANIEQKTVKFVAETTSKMKVEEIFNLNKKTQSIDLNEEKVTINLEDKKGDSGLK